MATLQISGTINQVFTVTFTYKKQEIEISVNDKGSHVELRVDGIITHDIYGGAYDWQSTYGLYGAANKMATIGQLRKHAIHLLETPVEIEED